MTQAEQIVARQSLFEKLHKAFYDYFIAELQKDKSAFTKYRLQHDAQFFSTLDLQRIVQPLFAESVTTTAEKQAVARAALYDALIAHTFGSFLENMGKQAGAGVAELEQSTGKAVSALHTLVNQEIAKVTERIDYLMENQNVSKGKQARKGPEEGPAQ